MSQTEDTPPSPRNYRPGTGPQRYSEFCRDWLGLETTYPQREILEALEQHRRVVVVTGNGIGKSYIAAGGSIAALYCNTDCTVNITSGSYGQMDDTIWKPITSLHRQSQLPGRTLDNTRELRTELDEEWFLRCLSPRHPSELEGRHNDRMIYIVEEADKPGITPEHIDSVESTVTDSDDRVLVIANPPEDEGNVVHDLMESEKWETINFSSWDSHNVRVERGLEDGDKIGGIIDTSEIRENWEDWNGEQWPGLESAIAQSTKGTDEFRTDLDTRWYRRRAGVMPPEGSDKWRPFGISDVEAAYNRAVEATEFPDTVGIDVARSGDNTVATGKHGNELRTHYARKGTNHRTQKEELKGILFKVNSPELAVDAVGEGSGLADELAADFAHVERFSNGMKPAQESDYYDAWAEALDLFGDFLDSGGAITDRHLYEEAKAAARSVEFGTRSLTSRGGDVIEATSKSVIKDRLGRSPDYLDSALMANWLDMAEHDTVEVVRRNGNRSRSGNTL